jgi:hypothetical protein
MAKKDLPHEISEIQKNITAGKKSRPEKRPWIFRSSFVQKPVKASADCPFSKQGKIITS